MLTKIKQFFTDMWETFKAFCAYSHTVMLARFTMISGLVTASIGLMDWSPLFSLFGTSTDFSPKQVAYLGIGTFAKGVLDEIVRRYKAVMPTE